MKANNAPYQDLNSIFIECNHLGTLSNILLILRLQSY